MFPTRVLNLGVRVLVRCSPEDDGYSGSGGQSGGGDDDAGGQSGK